MEQKIMNEYILKRTRRWISPFSALFFTLLYCISAALCTAQNPSPAPPQSESILILNGTAHLGNGQIILNSAIGLKDGKIVLAADATRVKFDKDSYQQVIDATGKQI